MEQRIACVASFPSIAGFVDRESTWHDAVSHSASLKGACPLSQACGLSMDCFRRSRACMLHRTDMLYRAAGLKLQISNSVCPGTRVHLSCSSHAVSSANRFAASSPAAAACSLASCASFTVIPGITRDGKTLSNPHSSRHTYDTVEIRQ